MTNTEWAQYYDVVFLPGHPEDESADMYLWVHYHAEYRKAWRVE